MASFARLGLCIVIATVVDCSHIAVFTQQACCYFDGNTCIITKLWALNFEFIVVECSLEDDNKAIFKKYHKRYFCMNMYLAQHTVVVEKYIQI